MLSKYLIKFYSQYLLIFSMSNSKNASIIELSAGGGQLLSMKGFQRETGFQREIKHSKIVRKLKRILWQ